MRSWLWWHCYFWPRLRFNETRDKFYRWLAWKLPRQLAMWAYVRVYTYATPNIGPSEEYAIVATCWEQQQHMDGR